MNIVSASPVRITLFLCHWVPDWMSQLNANGCSGLNGTVWVARHRRHIARNFWHPLNLARWTERFFALICQIQWGALPFLNSLSVADVIIAIPSSFLCIQLSSNTGNAMPGNLHSAIIFRSNIITPCKFGWRSNERNDVRCSSMQTHVVRIMAWLVQKSTFT